MDNSVNLTDISSQLENLECAVQMVILVVFIINYNLNVISANLIRNSHQSADIQTKTSSAEQYFKHGVLKENPDISSGIGLPDLKLVGTLAACWLLLFLSLSKGVASSGKVAYVTG